MEFQPQWERRSGEIGMTKHHIKLALHDIRPNNLDSSCVRPKAREFWKKKIARML